MGWVGRAGLDWVGSGWIRLAWGPPFAALGVLVKVMGPGKVLTRTRPCLTQTGASSGKTFLGAVFNRQDNVKF